MITVETNKPVYSNAKGEKTAEEKKALRAKRYESVKNLYQKGKESGLLSSLENLALNVGQPAGQGTRGEVIGKEQYVVDTGKGKDDEKKPMNPYLKWGLIIGGVALTGFAVYWFGFRKKGAKK